jgi:hypothetical protein
VQPRSEFRARRRTPRGRRLHRALNHDRGDHDHNEALEPSAIAPARCRHTLVLALLAAISFAACGGADAPGDQAAGEQGASASDGTPIRIAFGDTELTARLHDNATARDLAAQLQLTLTFRDHNNVEKTAPLPRELSLDGAPEGHDPAAGDLGYWAPDGDLVFYYDSDAPFFNGIVRIGELDALERQSEDFSVTIERAE